MPEDISDSDKYIRIPHKNDLDLGQNLIFKFVAEHLPDGYDKVRDIFRKRGAYSRYKSLLANKDMLDQWYKFEEKMTEQVLREYLEDEGIEFVD